MRMTLLSHARVDDCLRHCLRSEPMEPDDDRPPEPVRRAAALRETRQVLSSADAAWSRFSCPATAECCQLSRTGRPPWLWPSEWALIEQQLHRDRRALPPERADGGCPFLDPGGTCCTIYAVRPFGCRTFFCHRIRGPQAQPTVATNDLLRQLGGANQAWLDEAEPAPLPEWIARARAR